MQFQFNKKKKKKKKVKKKKKYFYHRKGSRKNTQLTSVATMKFCNLKSDIFLNPNTIIV